MISVPLSFAETETKEKSFEKTFFAVINAVAKSANSESEKNIADENVPKAPRYIDAIDARFDGVRQLSPLAVAAIQAFCPPILWPIANAPKTARVEKPMMRAIDMRVRLFI